MFGVWDLGFGDLIKLGENGWIDIYVKKRSSQMPDIDF